MSEVRQRKRKVSSSSSSESTAVDHKTSTQILNELFGAFEVPATETHKSKKSKKEKKKKKEKHKHKHKEKDKDRDRHHKSKKSKKDKKSGSENSSRRVSTSDRPLGIEIRVNDLSEFEGSSMKTGLARNPSPVSSPPFRTELSPSLSPSPPFRSNPSPPFRSNPSPPFRVGAEEPMSEPEENPEIDELTERNLEFRDMSPPSVIPKVTENEPEGEIFEKAPVVPAPVKPSTGLLVGPSKCRIQIKSLKTSTVFEQTVREVEEEARKRAEKFEEGELTPSSSSHAPESSSPSLSDVDLPPNAPSPPPPVSSSTDAQIDSVKSSKDVGKIEKRRRSSHSKRPKEKESSSKHKDKSRRSTSREHKSRRHGESGSRERHREHRHSRDAIRDNGARESGRDGARESSRDSRRREHRRSRERSPRSFGWRPRSRERERWRGSRDGRDRRERREDGNDNDERIDKRKLLAIARRNAMYLLKEQQERMIQAGIMTGESGTTVTNLDSKSGKTVAELTEYCKQLVKSGSGSSDDDSDVSLSEGDGPTESFIHHPFTLRDRPNAIIMNIRNSTQLPTRSMQEKAAETSKMRSLQFPVSSGQQHRSSEWVPVSPKKDPEPVPAPDSKSKQPLAICAPPPKETNQVIDIGSIISQKLSAMRKLQESTVGPDYGYGYGQQQNLQSGNLSWESGQFTGTTGARVLTPAELASGQQAWARKDQLKTAAPVASGMGMKLLQKMGWRPGEGLGKNKEGSLEPLKLDVKFDKKGLLSQEEAKPNRFQPFSGSKKRGGALPSNLPPGMGIMSAPISGGGEIFSGKHPVSALVELCTKRHWNPPTFDIIFESGPDHKKNFVFKVSVNNKEYQPQLACGNKKQAKAMAAQYCLEQLGLVVKMASSKLPSVS